MVAIFVDFLSLQAERPMVSLPPFLQACKVIIRQKGRKTEEKRAISRIIMAKRIIKAEEPE